MRRPLFAVILIVLGMAFVAVNSAGSFTKLTNLKCQSLDEQFASFERCDLKVFQRGHIGANVYVRLHRLPVNNVSLYFQLLRKSNTYQPFFIKYDLDFCNLMKFNAKTLIISTLLKYLQSFSNVNHTCPFDHDIIISNFELSNDLLKATPFPPGEYMALVKVGAYNEWKAVIKFFITFGDN